MKRKTYLVIGVVVLIVIGIAVGAVVAVKKITDTISMNLHDAVGTTTNMITSDTVVEKIQQVSELTTTKYTIQLVAKSETVGGFLLLGTTNVKMLLIAKGTVRAGLDLAKLDPSEVRVSDDGKSVTVHLPEVKILDPDQILSSNPSDTYVYDVQKGIAADTTNTETQLRGLANDQILEAACKDGIMDEAAKNAKTVIEQLLKTSVPEVTVISAPVPSVDECKANTLE